MFSEPGVNVVARHIQVDSCHRGSDPQRQRHSYQTQRAAGFRILDWRTLGNQWARVLSIEHEQGEEPDERERCAGPEYTSREKQAAANGENGESAAQHHGFSGLIQTVVQLKKAVVDVA